MVGFQENYEHSFLPSKKETKLFIPDDSKIMKRYTNLNQQVKNEDKLPRLQILLVILVAFLIVGWLAILTGTYILTLVVLLGALEMLSTWICLKNQYIPSLFALIF